MIGGALQFWIFTMLKLIAAGVCLSTPAMAGPDRASILLGSHHAGASIPFEAANPGLFFTWEDRTGGIDWSVGIYRNSYGRASVAVTAALPVYEAGETEVSLFMGAALYPQDGRYFRAHLGDVVPIAGVMVQYRSLFVQVLPSDGRAADGVLSMGLSWELE